MGTITPGDASKLTSISILVAHPGFRRQLIRLRGWNWLVNRKVSRRNFDTELAYQIYLAMTLPMTRWDPNLPDEAILTARGFLNHALQLRRPRRR